VTALGKLKEGANPYLKFHGFDGTGEIAIIAYEGADEAARILQVIGKIFVLAFFPSPELTGLKNVMSFVIVQINKVYQLISFEVQREDSRYPQHCGTNLQLIMQPDSKLIWLASDKVPGIPFQFVEISEIFGDKFEINAKIGEHFNALRTRRNYITDGTWIHV